jgi:hypothetical protein
MAEYEGRFAVIGEELKRLNGVLRNKADELGIVREELVQAKEYGLGLKEEKERLVADTAALRRENDRLKGVLE